MHKLALAALALAVAACSGDNLFSATRVVAGPGGADDDSLGVSPDLTAEFFLDVAFDNEFGPATDAIRKWTGSPDVELINATADDLVTVDNVLGDIAAITGLRPTVVPTNGDIRVFFTARDEFDQIADVPTSVEGATVASWDFDFQLVSATVVVDSAATDSRRRHIIREELTQAFGLLRDSWRVQSSIFYRGASTRTEFGAIDEDVLAILYSSVILPGMTRAQVMDVLDARP